MAFTFRQRVGKLNWKIISSVNVDNVIENSDTVELQSVIDVVTFSEFYPGDVRANTIESISKLVNIMQLVIEYILYCQESQCRLLQVMQERNSSLRKKCASMKKELISLSEDNKIYQRQLHLLRNSLMKSQHLLGQPSSPRVVLGGEEDTSRQAGKSGSDALIETVLQHERDNREFLRVLLDEQRSTFFSEMTKLAREKDRGEGDSDRLAQRRAEEAMRDMTSRLCSQVEGLLQTTITSMGDSSVKLLEAMARQSKSAPALPPAPAQAPVATPTVIIEKAPDMSHFESEIKARDVKIESLTASLRDVEAAFGTEKAAWTASKQQLTLNIKSLSDRLSQLLAGSSVSDALTVRCQKLALGTVCRLFLHVELRSQRQFFRHWAAVVSEAKLASLDGEHARRLRSAATSHERRESELVSQLQSEREKTRALQELLNAERDANSRLGQKKLSVECGVMTEPTRSPLSASSIDQAFLTASDDELMRRAASRVSSSIKSQDEVDLMNQLANEITGRLRHK